MKSKFKVGDRVRIILRGNWNYGKHATVTEIVDAPLRIGNGFVCGACHKLDVDGVGTRNKSGEFIAYFAENLEPLYDGDEKSSWEAMKDIWQPKGVTA